ncbi:cdc25-like protein phosphatase twine-related [Anaeramoeba flamelloides]|uniref:protein-tyrosine-phosphatase n=1 Tax=Anaeramoeba flamelloides TaxID=1746091 RepID=A0ABQ8XM37_9EUKA|nr:cdc25-like protein phosphatase twine-related [Anaeramoeba flamelloides]
MNNLAFSHLTNRKAKNNMATHSRNPTGKASGTKKKQAIKHQSLQPQKENNPHQKRHRSLQLRKNKSQSRGYQKTHESCVISFADKSNIPTRANLFQTENPFQKNIKKKKTSTKTKRKNLNFTRNRPRNFNHKTQTTTISRDTSHKKNVFNQRNPLDKQKKRILDKPQNKFPNLRPKHIGCSSSPELREKFTNLKINKNTCHGNDSQNIQDKQNIQVTQKKQKRDKKSGFRKNQQKCKVFPQEGNKNPKKSINLHKSSSFPFTKKNENKRIQEQQQTTLLFQDNLQLDFGILNSTFIPIDEEENSQNSTTDKQTSCDQTAVSEESNSNKQGNKIESKRINKNKHKLKTKEKEQEKEKKRDRKQNKTLPKNEELSGVPTSLFSPSKILNKRNVKRSYSRTPQESFLNSRINSSDNNSNNSANQEYLSNPKKKIRKTRLQRSNSLNLLFQENFDPKIYEKQKPLLPVTKGKPIELNTISQDTLCDLLDGSYKKKYGFEFSKVIIIDCRFDWEYEGGHISGAKNWNLPKVLLHKLFCKKIRENVCLVFHCEFSQHRGPKMCKLLRRTDRKINAYPNLHYPQVYVLEKGYKEFFRHSDRAKKFCYPQGYRKMLNKKYQTQMHEDSRQFKLKLKLHQRRNILSLDDILNWYGSLKQPITIRHNQVKKSSNLRTSFSLSQETNSTTKTISNSTSSSTTTSAMQKKPSSLSKRDRTNSSLCRKRPLQSFNRPNRGFTLTFGNKTGKCQESLFNECFDSDLNLESDSSLFQSSDLQEFSKHFQKETTIRPNKTTTKKISKIRTVLKFDRYPILPNSDSKNQNNFGTELGMDLITDTDTDTDNDKDKDTCTTTETETHTVTGTDQDNANDHNSCKSKSGNSEEENETKNEKSNDNNSDSGIETKITTNNNTLIDKNTITNINTSINIEPNSCFNCNSIKKKKKKKKKKKMKKKKKITNLQFSFSQPTFIQNHTDENNSSGSENEFDYY